MNRSAMKKNKAKKKKEYKVLWGHCNFISFYFLFFLHKPSIAFMVEATLNHLQHSGHLSTSENLGQWIEPYLTQNTVGYLVELAVAES